MATGVEDGKRRWQGLWLTDPFSPLPYLHLLLAQFLTIMPQVYRRQPQSVPQPAVTDADDSIVLSDLVRTGEASRLRRRGAMRIDHNSTRSVSSATVTQSIQVLPPLPSTSAPQRTIIMAPSRPSTPPWATSDPQGDDEFTYGGSEWRDWTLNTDTEENDMQAEDTRRETTAAYADTEEPVMLFCGGQLQSQPQDKAFVPSLFPRHPSSSKHSPTTPTGPRTNGCGAVVHMQAFPQRPRGVWVGKEDATPAVVGLDSCYFERSVVAKMLKSACGCIREGIGCAVWYVTLCSLFFIIILLMPSISGNTLGTRYMPCQAASAGLFACNSPTPCSRSTPLHPSGPEYWDCSSTLRSQASSSASSPNNFYVYTFFGDHVTAAPTYHRPPNGHPTTGYSTLQDRVPPPPTREAPRTARTSAIWAEEPARPSFVDMGALTTSPRPLTPNPLPPYPPSNFNSTSLPQSLPPLPRITQRTTVQTALRSPQLRLEVPLPPSLRRIRRADSRSSNDDAYRIGDEYVDGDDDEDVDGMNVVELDADGVVIQSDTEPNSPDKVGDAGLLWPGR